MEGGTSFPCGLNVKYTCNEGYWLLGAEASNCGLDEQWSNGKPTCINKSKKFICLIYFVCSQGFCDFRHPHYDQPNMTIVDPPVFSKFCPSVSCILLDILQFDIKHKYAIQYSQILCFLPPDQGCGEPPKINNTQRFGSVTEVTYKCDECQKAGGSATCHNGEWYYDGNCDSKWMHGAEYKRKNMLSLGIKIKLRILIFSSFKRILVEDQNSRVTLDSNFISR